MHYQPLTPRRPLQVREIYTVHYFEYTSACSFPGESHDFWELLYVDRGELQVTAGERTCRLGRGSSSTPRGSSTPCPPWGWRRTWWW